MQSVEEIHYPNLDARIRVFRHGEVVDTFVVVTRRYLIPIDTGTRPEGMEQVMEAVSDELGSRTLLAINTHADWDHVWGNGLFLAPDAHFPAPVIAHRLAAERMRAPRAAEQLASMQATEPEVYGRAAWWIPTLLTDRIVHIDGGDLSIELIPTPGHTPDHYALWIPELRLVLAGDAAEMPFPLVSQGGSLTEIRASLRRMAALDPAIALYCHAPGVTSPDLLQRNSRYFDELESRCRERGPGLLHAEQPAEVLDWPAQEAATPAWIAPDGDTLDFYRRFHDANIRASARELFDVERV
jgi:glyoxylase-like metal-dependent hydrolase (beta-lactamase superfamily II)